MENRYDSILSTEIMQRFPSGTAAATFGDWVANHAGLEQVLGIAGFFAVEFIEVNGLTFWDAHVAKFFEDADPTTSFGSTPEMVERYYNIVNLAEFFLGGADQAVHQEDLVEAFGRVLQHFWSAALRERFPERTYRFEVTHDLFNEDGLCLTFWQNRS